MSLSEMSLSELYEQRDEIQRRIELLEHNLQEGLTHDLEHLEQADDWGYDPQTFIDADYTQRTSFYINDCLCEWSNCECEAVKEDSANLESFNTLRKKLNAEGNIVNAQFFLFTKKESYVPFSISPPKDGKDFVVVWVKPKDQTSSYDDQLNSNKKRSRASDEQTEAPMLLCAN